MNTVGLDDLRELLISETATPPRPSINTMVPIDPINVFFEVAILTYVYMCRPTGSFVVKDYFFVECTML